MQWCNYQNTFNSVTLGNKWTTNGALDREAGFKLDNECVISEMDSGIKIWAGKVRDRHKTLKINLFKEDVISLVINDEFVVFWVRWLVNWKRLKIKQMWTNKYNNKYCFVKFFNYLRRSVFRTCRACELYSAGCSSLFFYNTRVIWQSSDELEKQLVGLLYTLRVFQWQSEAKCRPRQPSLSRSVLCSNKFFVRRPLLSWTVLCS